MGIPSAQIFIEADESRSDLIIIAFRVLSDVHIAVFGSTTDKVIHSANCSVLVSRKPNNTH